MEKSIIKKLTFTIIFIIFFLQAFSPLKTDAAAISWDNPNKNGTNPYKFRIQDSVNSALIMQVVGCTGVVDKVSAAITNFTSTQSKKIQRKIKERAKQKACDRAKKAIEGSVAFVGKEFVAAIADDVRMCNTPIPTEAPDTTDAIDDQTRAEKASKRRDECLNGIAKTLAKNQLTAMTRYTMNWITTGFNGDPLYVKNIKLFMGSLEKIAVKKEIDFFKDANNANYYPYGLDFAKGQASYYSGGTDLHSALRQDLVNYIYTGKGDTANTNWALENYANNFSAGGWEGWLGLTQKDQNNPLGFNLLATNGIAREQARQEADINAQLTRNGGILDQKKCVEYDKTNEKAIKEMGDELNLSLAIRDKTCDVNEGSGPNSDACVAATKVYGQDLAKLNSLKDEKNQKCIKWETVTPGSLIKDKVSTTLNSDVRQLELAKDINDSLNAVFTVLLSKLQNQGLTSLSSAIEDSSITTYDGLGGEGSNRTTNDEVDENGNIVRSIGSGFSGSFDLTKELGNTYTHTYNHTSLGYWNAGNNTPKLYPGVGTAGTFYIVSVPGKTKLINNGYNGWEKGDRAYFNGTEWQNWKQGQTNPIDKRGIIQIQKDFVVGATEILKVLPTVMPKLGELDACIPGPNPNWEGNASEASDLFLTLTNTLSTTYQSNGFINANENSTYTMAGPGDVEYEDYKNIFNGSNSLWNNGVTETYAWNQLQNWLNKNWESEDSLAIVEDQVQNLLARINSHINQFFSTYDKFIADTYGPLSPLQNEYQKSELTGFKLDTSGNKIKNAGYLPMAQAGLEITKDMLSYSDTVNEAVEGYKNSIYEANANVEKLEQIKREVADIVAEAQSARWDDRLKQILKNDDGTPMTQAQYKEKYKDCLEEEQPVFYDEDQIMSNSNEDGKCENGIDDDLDGLVDIKDPDCPGYTEPTSDSYTPTNSTRSTSNNGYRR